MAAAETYAIGLDTPLAMLTPRQLFGMMAEWRDAEEKREKTGGKERPERWFVNSAGELARIIGTSEATVYRMKRDGLLDDAISQCGRWMCIDVNAVLDKFKLSNVRKPSRRKQT